jgi:hypothetical protein
MTIKFKDALSAQACVAKMNGRFFDKQRVRPLHIAGLIHRYTPVYIQVKNAFRNLARVWQMKKKRGKRNRDLTILRVGLSMATRGIERS